MYISKEKEFKDALIELQNNNFKIKALTHRNRELMHELEMLTIFDVTPEQKKRYDDELASDNWKKYSKTFNSEHSQDVEIFYNTLRGEKTT